MSKWESSQKYEKQYSIDGIKQWDIPFSEQYWLDFMHITKINSPALEVGCGNFGIWRFNKTIMGLDPIDFSDLGTNFIQSKAETIPYPDNHFRDVYCINALDHTEDPIKAMSEMARVCSDRLIIWVYVFNKIMQPLFNIMYRPHPHCFTTGDFISASPFPSDLIPTSMKIETSQYISPTRELLQYTKQLIPRSKVQIAETFGMKGLLLHLRKKV
jgi:hypothetical protein